MADITIQDVRAKFPQYDDMSDEQLGAALHKKYYSDIPQEQFFSKIGLAVKPEPSFTDKALGVGEAAASLLSGMAGGLGGGLTYAGAAPFVGDSAAQAMKSGVEEAFTYQPRGDIGQEYMQNIGGLAQTYIADPMEKASSYLGEKELQMHQDSSLSPERIAAKATSAYMIPQVLVEAGALFSGGGMSRLARAKSAKQKQKGQDLERQLSPDNNDYEGAAKTIREADPKAIAELIDADPELINSIDELGLNADALASYYSNNRQYRAIEQGLASVDASDLNIQQKRFVQELAAKADRIITENGGTLDKSLLGDDIKAEMLKSIDDIYAAEDVLYTNIRNVLPPQTKVKADNTLSYLESYASEVGGIENLPPSLRRLYGELRPKTTTKQGAFNYATGKKSLDIEEVHPAYGLLNDRRSQIGQQLARGESVFKNVEQGRLKQLYAAMKRDQNSIIDEQGSESLSNMKDSANNLTILRKKIESDSQDLMGKDLDKGIMEAVGGAVKSLGTDRPKIDKFIATINKIPENRRQEAVLSAMNEAWKGTAASKNQLGEAQFARYWENINRSPRVKAELFKYLPPESRRSIENLGKVNAAVYRANQNMISTGRISAFLDDRGGTMNRLANKLIPAVAMAGAAKVNPMAAFGVKELFENSTDAAKSANKMLASRQFQQLVEEAVKNGVNNGMAVNKKTLAMEKAFMKSETYAQWANRLEPEQKALIARVGLTNYLIRPYKEESSEQSRESQGGYMENK